VVSTRVEPEAGACQLYQTDLPPTLPAWFGSPGSFVAPTLVPLTIPLLPERTCAAAKASLLVPELGLVPSNSQPSE
jgi:hypothetical protein